MVHGDYSPRFYPPSTRTEGDWSSVDFVIIIIILGLMVVMMMMYTRVVHDPLPTHDSDYLPLSNTEDPRDATCHLKEGAVDELEL